MAKKKIFTINDDLIKEKKTNPILNFFTTHSLFAILALFFGTYFILYTPPMQVPDERAHIKRAYYLSEITNEITKKDSIYVISLPVSLDSLVNPFNYLLWQPNNKIKSKEIKSVLKFEINTELRKDNFFDANNYFYFSYIPQIPAWWICRALNGSVLFYYYLGRFFALFFYVSLIYFAIKITPFAKYVFFSIALFPMSLSLAGSFNPDSVNISITILLLACFFNVLSKNPSHVLFTKYFILGATLIIGVLKTIYFPFIFLILFVPRSFFKTQLNFYLYKTLGVSLGLLFAFAWYKYFSYTAALPQGSVGDELIKPDLQIAKIINHPLEYLNIIFYTFEIMYKFYYQSIIGILGYLDTMLKPWMYSYVFLSLILSVFISNNIDFKINNYQRFGLLLMCLAIILLTMTGMFLITPINSTVIVGVQGRYFIPALICLACSISGFLPTEFKHNVFKNKILLSVIVIIIFVILYNTVEVLKMRYFGRF